MAETVKSATGNGYSPADMRCFTIFAMLKNNKNERSPRTFRP